MTTTEEYYARVKNNLRLVETEFDILVEKRNNMLAAIEGENEEGAAGNLRRVKSVCAEMRRLLKNVLDDLSDFR